MEEKKPIFVGKHSDLTQASLLEQLANWKIILVVFLVTLAFDLFILSGRTNELRSDSGLTNLPGGVLSICSNSIW